MTDLRELESRMDWVLETGMSWVSETRMGSVLVAQLPMLSSIKALSLQQWLISS
jgi:hypothetical protein